MARRLVPSRRSDPARKAWLLERWLGPGALVAIGAPALLWAPSPWSYWGAGAILLGVVVGILQRRALNSFRLQVEERIDRISARSQRRQEKVEQYQGFLEALPVGVMTVRSGRGVYANPAARQVLGERVTAAGAPLPGPVRDAIRQASSGQVATARFSQGLPRRVMEVSVRPIGEDGLVLLQVSDITDLSLADRVRRDFVVAASHELKTPVAAIKSAAETVLLALEDDPDAVADFSARILDNAVRMGRIVTDLLDLSRLESGSLPMEACDLSDVARQVAERFLPSLPTIEVNLESVPMMGNPAYLDLACRNLLENAVRHTPEHGRIRLSVVGDEAEAVLVVEDSGTGIPSDHLPRIFERFYRADEARSKEMGGTGLGLAIVMHVVDLHQGRIEVESTLGRGSTFRVRLPIGTNYSASEQAASTASATRSTTAGLNTEGII